MANRDLTTFNSVQQVVAKQASGLESAIADVGMDIITRSQEAKIAENMSKAQLEINALDNKFRIDNQADPLNPEALKAHKENRQAILAKYGDEISPLFGRQWQERTRGLSYNSDLANQNWGFQQARVNTVESINTSIKNNLSLAAQNGQAYAEGRANDLNLLLDFQPGRDELAKFAAGNLGEMDANKLLNDYGSDYVKSFVSGVAQTSASKALKLMDTPAVKGAITDKQEYNNFKTVLKNRAIHESRVAEGTRKAAAVGNKLDMLVNSSGESYAELETMLSQKFAEGDLSPREREILLRSKGWAEPLETGPRGGVTAGAKDELKRDVYDTVAAIAMQSESMDIEQLRLLQEKIYYAVDNQAITTAEAEGLSNQLAVPLLGKYQENLSKNTVSKGWFSGDLGYDGIEDYYNEIKRPTGDGDKTSIKASNNRIRADLMQNYYLALQEVASKQVKDDGTRGVTVADLEKLPTSRQKEVYKEAQEIAIGKFINKRFPKTQRMDDLPDAVVSTTGEKVSAKGTGSALNPDAVVQPVFRMATDPSTGKRYRVYEDGTTVEVVGE